MRPVPLAATTLATAALLSGCGGGDSAQTGTTEAPPPNRIPFAYVNLQGKASPEDAGLLLAHRLGYFPRARVHVIISTPAHPTRPPRYMDEERVAAALANGPQLILAREEGRPLVAIGSLVAQPTMAMIWLRGSGIDGIADLKGRTIAYPGVGFQRLFLKAILKRAGLTLADVKLQVAGNYLEDELVTHRADAIFGGSRNTEARLLESHRLHPVVTPVTKLGVPAYDELVMITRRNLYEEDPAKFESLVQATTDGNGEVAERPGIAAKAVREERGRERPLPTIQAGVEELAPQLSRTGEIDRAKMRRLIGWMYAEGMIRRKWPVSQLIRPSGATEAGSP